MVDRALYDSKNCNLEDLLIWDKTQLVEFEPRILGEGQLRLTQQNKQILAYLNRTRNPKVNIRITPFNAKDATSAETEIFLFKRAFNLLQERRTPHIVRYVTSIYCQNLSESIREGEYFKLRARKFSQTSLGLKGIDILAPQRINQAGILILENKGVDFVFDVDEDEFLDILFQVGYTLRELAQAGIRTNGVNLNQIKVSQLTINNIYYFLEDDVFYQNLNERKLQIKIDAFYDGTYCDNHCENEKFDLGSFISSCRDNLARFKDPNVRTIISNLNIRFSFKDHLLNGTFNLYGVDQLKFDEFPVNSYSKGNADMILPLGVYVSQLTGQEAINYINNLYDKKLKIFGTLPQPILEEVIENF